MSKLHLTNKETGLREFVNTDLVENYTDLYIGPEGEELTSISKKSKKVSE